MRAIAIVAVTALLPAHVAQADIWTEVGDAGQNGVGAAQVTVGADPLEEIHGTLSSGSDVDIFCITITDFASFSATTLGGTGLDTKLYLFNADGTGQVMNDDFGGGFQSKITDQGVFANGTYYLAISRFGVGARNAANTSIFSNSVWPGPDPGQNMPIASAGPLDHWTTSTNPGGTYIIKLTGAGFAIPGPASAMLLGVAALLGSRRRRRS